MNEAKFEPFIFIKRAVLLLVIIAIGSTATFIPRDSKVPEKTVQPMPTTSAPCRTRMLPEVTVPVESSIPTSMSIRVTSETPMPIESPNPYINLTVTDSDKELLACMAYSEARGEPFEGQIAVVQVALNRYMHEAFDGNISEILLAPNQFSVGSVYGEEQMKAVEAALAGEPVLDLNTDVVFFSTGRLTYGSYYKTIGGHVFRTYL